MFISIASVIVCNIESGIKMKEKIMNLNFDVNILDEEQSLLQEIFECNEGELATKIEHLSKASVEEYLRMMLGQKVFTRGQDIKEYRLYLLIKYLFEGNIPDEQMITTLFQTTSSESKSLLKSVLAKFQYDLKQSITNTITEILNNKVEYDDQKDIYFASNISLNIVDEMNKILSGINGALSQISKKKNTLQTFEIQPASLIVLAEHFNVEVAEHENE